LKIIRKKTKTCKIAALVIALSLLIAVFGGAAQAQYQPSMPPSAQMIIQNAMRPGGMNPYIYALNNPYKYTDPSGLDVVPPGYYNTYYNNPGAIDPQSAAFGMGVALSAGAATVFEALAAGEVLQEAQGLAKARAVPGPLAAPGEQCLEGGLRFGEFKSPTKWQNQMLRRGWTPQQINEAVSGGQSFPAVNNVNPGNPALRFMHPDTGQSVVIDTKTLEVLHVGGPGFQY
jgi:hypothetical protein